MADASQGPGADLVETRLSAQRVHSRRLWPGIAAAGSYLALAMIANLFAWLHGAGHELQKGGDLAQEAWFIGFTPYAVVHGHNPLLTNWMNYPYGVNLMANTAMFLPAILLSPVTFIWGPVASLNVMLVLGLAGSAAAAYFVLLRWVSWRPAAYVGGLLYGFSPYMDGQGWGHFFLIFAMIPPLLLLVLDEIVVTQRHGAVGWGMLLGLLLVAQLFISTEVLSSELVMGAAGVVLLVCFRWRLVKAHIRHAVTSFASGLVTFAAISCYPLWVLLFGAQHIDGPAQPVRALAPYSADLVGLFVPMSNQAISPFQDVTRSFVRGDVAESDAYIGITLVIVLAWIVIRYRKVALVRFGAAMTAVAGVLSLGARLRVDGEVTDIHLPFVVLTRLPLFDSSIAIRYSLYVFLFAGLVLAVGLDRIHAEGLGPIPSGRKASIACALVAAFALFPLIPRWPYPMTDTGVPAFFRSPAVTRIAPGSTLLTYPFPRGPHDQAMLWQVENGLRYRLPGGYVITPAGPRRLATFSGVASVTENLLNDAYEGSPLPVLSPAVLAQVRHDLAVWQIETIVVTSIGRDPGEAVHLFTAALDRAPADVNGSEEWTGVSELLRTAGH